MKAHKAEYVLEGRRLKILHSSLERRDGEVFRTQRTKVECRCGAIFTTWLPTHKVVCHRCNNHAKVRRVTQ